MHRHRTSYSETVAFAGPVASERPDPRAHGGFTEICYCACGASRRDNHNQGYRERGHWRTTTDTVAPIRSSRTTGV